MATINSFTTPLFYSLMFATLISTAVGLKASMTCKRENVKKHFRTIFSLSVLHNTNVIAQIDSNSAGKVLPNSTIPVLDVSGSLEGDTVNISVTLEMECHMMQFIRCELFGLPTDMQEYKTEDITPHFTFEVDVTNTSSRITPQKDWYVRGDNVIIKCSADVGSSDEKWQFQVVAAGIRHTVDDKLVTTSVTPSLPLCLYHTSATINYSITATDNIEVNCQYGKTEVGLTSIQILDVHDKLSFHLLLSSVLLVYCPFVIMPTVWCFCPVCTKTWRNPDNSLYKALRSGVSFLNEILFSVWWIWVYHHYGQAEEITSFTIFAFIEGIFILGYAIYRCLFRYLERKDNWFGVERAYHSRVTTSHGAVMTPVICWLMIRIPKRLPITGVEVIFWITACISVLVFAFVSHQREWNDWRRKSK